VGVLALYPLEGGIPHRVAPLVSTQYWVHRFLSKRHHGVLSKPSEDGGIGIREGKITDSTPIRLEVNLLREPFVSRLHCSLPRCCVLACFLCDSCRDFAAWCLPWISARAPSVSRLVQ
jgi:hypothetical protein